MQTGYHWTDPIRDNALDSYFNDEWNSLDEETMKIKDIWKLPDSKKKRSGEAAEDEQFEGGASHFQSLSEYEKRERIQQLWNKARRYCNKLRFQARLNAMEERQMKWKLINMSEDEAALENEENNQPRQRLKWYLIDKDGAKCKAWDFLITIILIYELIMVPYFLVFDQIYEPCLYTYADKTKSLTPPKGNDIPKSVKGPLQKCVPTTNPTLSNIEMLIDLIFLVEIILNMFKRTRAHRDLPRILQNYLFGYFVFDVVSTIPELFMNEGYKHYWFKAFRLVHYSRLAQPIIQFLGHALRKLSQKRKNDLTSFIVLIVWIFYTCHFMGCIWLKVGLQDNCEKLDKSTGQQILDETCTQSWVYAQKFDTQPCYTQYINSFYFIFDVMTTVGYGNWNGNTTNEYIFSIILEFMGLTFFAFLMGSINGIFNTKDSFDDLVEAKFDELDFWVKKMEKQNKPFKIRPTIYCDIRKYCEQAYLYDFNFLIEEFPFYQQLTPKLQTDIIQSTRTLKEFETQFNHFFDECERGFTNEIIINLYCRIHQPGKVIISYQSQVHEMFFTRRGVMDVLNNENDSVEKDKPILYLPDYSTFGDYQILFNLKSNLVFKTHKDPEQEYGPDIIFMCVAKDVLLELCDLFPQTAENIKRRSLEARQNFMLHKNSNSKSFQLQDNTNSDQNNLEDFYSDEEPHIPENEQQNKDKKTIGHFVEALKQTIVHVEDQANKGPSETKSAAEFFEMKINNK